MPPAASDDLFQSRFQGDPSLLPEDLHRVTTAENDSGGRSKKKGKKGTKKNKGAEAVVAKPPSEDLIEATPPPPPEPSSCPEPPIHSQTNENNIKSPVLDALGSLGETPDNDITYRTDTWAQSIPYGKSPPNDALDGEIASGSPFGFLTSADKGGFSHPSSASPPARPRPMSYGTGYSNSDFSRQQSADRLKSHSLSSPFNNQIPPLPHLPQAHFYGAPDVDLPSFSGQNRSASEGNYSFCAFDSIPGPFSKSSRMGGTVLLVGKDGGLDVLAIEDRKSRMVGKLSGLNGRVIEAKVLACGLPNDSYASSRPHVAIIVHGPSGSPDDEGRASSAASETHEPSGNGRQSAAEKRSGRDDAKFYQTRVEVYSLRTGDHITTLFTTKPSQCLESIPGMPAFAPPPAGNLKVSASGSHVVLASGVSGEVYIYNLTRYHCLGKVWTIVQSREARRYSISSSSTDQDGSRTDSPHASVNLDGPIFALRGRWLSVVPPPSTHGTSIRGTVPTHLVHGKVLGLETHSPPTRPTVNCVTDVEGESLFNKVARGFTQEMVRGARWVGDQSLQAWHNYWNKEQGQSPPRRPAHLSELPQQGYGLFPPTHAQDTQTASSPESDFVSLFDLGNSGDGDSKSPLLNPVATFQIPNGCSFLSFSPNGLMLFTASKKGDVHYVWDLMQAKYCRHGAFMADEGSPPSTSVRQVARYARMTTSHIVDVIWCPPSGDRLAVITRKGTVHVFDLPLSAFRWPPFRRARPAPSKSPASDPPADELSDLQAGANPLSTAFRLVGGTTQPFLAAVRNRAPSASTAFTNVSGLALPSAAGVRSGKVVAAGLSKSMGAAASGTVNTLRHVGENRLRLPGLAVDPAASRVIWISHKDQPYLGLVDSGLFRLYRVKRSIPTHKGRLPQSIIGAKEVEYPLPETTQSPCGPLPVGTVYSDTVHCSPLALPTTNPRSSLAPKIKCQPLSQAELETNKPYQPFHTDQRVNLFLHSETSDAANKLLPSGQWVFGESLPMTKLHVRPFSPSGDDEDEDDEADGQHTGLRTEMENHIVSVGNNTANSEEIVITTRKKKRRSHSSPVDGDNGLAEDDWAVLDFARDRV